MIRNTIPLLALIALCLTKIANGQDKPKLDTIYYLVDTASTPKADRMFEVGQEGEFYGYRLTCQCLTWQQDAFFTYQTKLPGEKISAGELKIHTFITLRRLIEVAVQFGLDRKRRHVFFFVEKVNKNFVKHQVYLSEPTRSVAGF